MPIYYDKCVKCRGLDVRPEAKCNCPKNTKEKLKAQAAEIQQRGKRHVGTEKEQSA